MIEKLTKDIFHDDWRVTEKINEMIDWINSVPQNLVQNHNSPQILNESLKHGGFDSQETDTSDIKQANVSRPDVCIHEFADCTLWKCYRCGKVKDE